MLFLELEELRALPQGFRFSNDVLSTLIHQLDTVDTSDPVPAAGSPWMGMDVDGPFIFDNMFLKYLPNGRAPLRTLSVRRFRARLISPQLFRTTPTDSDSSGFFIYHPLQREHSN